MTTIVKTIASANFMATAVQVERLAAQVVDGQEADGTYLRVLLAHMQSKLGRARMRRHAKDSEAVTELLNAIHNDLYASVLRGVGPEDLDSKERNRRATFARSAASTVRYFISKGGDVREVEVPTVTKGSLRRSVEPEKGEAPEGETRMDKSFRKAQDALLEAAKRLMARGDPQDTARIEGLIEQLETLLEGAEEEQQPQRDVGADTTVITGHRLQRGPAATDHRPHA